MGNEEVRQAVDGRWLARGGDVQLCGATTDSRAAKAGELFIAISGEKYDGHAFLPQVAAAGCPTAIVRQDAAVPVGIAAKFAGGVIGVPDTLFALGKLAKHHRQLSSARVVAVTGSNGKTTTKRMIHHILRGHLRGTCSPKSFNNNIGVPLTLLGISAQDDYVVCEVGSNAPGEIAELAAICMPDIAVITSVGSTHLEKLGSLQGVAIEKASLLKHLRDGGTAIAWADSPELNAALAEYNCPLIWFGSPAAGALAAAFVATPDECNLRLTNHHVNGLSQRFEINGRLWVDLPMPGRHNAFNALAAIATAQQFGLSMQQAAAALADFDATDGRLQTIEMGGVTVINDAYNANPSSVLAAADVLADCAGRRRVMIVGDMRELGAASVELHRQAGRQIAQRGVELIIGVGDLGRHIAAGAAEAGVDAREATSVDEAHQSVPPLLREGDLVLIKGSRAMAMERLIEPVARRFGHNLTPKA